MEIIASQLKRVYSDAEYEGPKEEPADWWGSFGQRFESNTGVSRQQAHDLLQSWGACAHNCP